MKKLLGITLMLVSLGFVGIVRSKGDRVVAREQHSSREQRGAAVAA